MTTPEQAAAASRPARKGRLVLKPSDIDARELDALRTEVADLRAAHNDLVAVLNGQSRWVEQFAVAMRKTLEHAPWRYCAWILPLPIPPFQNREELPYLQHRDAKPDFGAHDD